MTTETTSEEGIRRTGEPIELVGAATGRMPCQLHRTPEGTLVGLGVAASARGRDGESLADVEARLRRRLVEQFGEGLPEQLRLFFQVAFDPGSSADPVWSGIQRVRVVAPRATMCWSEGVSTTARLDGEGVDELLDRAGSGDQKRAGAGSAELQIEWPAIEAYREAVRQAIAAEAVDKAVVARRARVTADRRIRPREVVATLDRRHPEARLFSLSPGPDRPTFVGASPERLIRLQGTRAGTMALAGTADCRDRPPGEAAEELLASGKARDEHDYVVEMITETLAGLGATVEPPDRPRPVRASEVVHLQTPIEARVADSHRLVDLVDALHPTPAVCGTPTAPARRLIDRVEPFDRGLYTGVVGWTDLEGNGDATVALRCGLLDGRCAHLFAGGGITAASEVGAEEAETTSKFAPMLDALREAMA